MRGGTDCMDASELSVGVIILFQTMIGVLANSSLLYHYMFLYLTRDRLRSIDWILVHLIAANILTVLFKGIPQTIAAFGLKDFLNDIGCKLIFSFRRIGRGVCIGSTSFLSVYQAIMISPSDSRHSELKLKMHKCIGYSVYLNWVIHFIISSVNLVHMRAKYSNESTTNLKSFIYCYAVRHDPTSDILYAALVSSPDILLLGLMLYASGFMVLTLYRHKQRMQQMPRMNVSSKSTPASRATKTILLLVSIFVSCYTISTICQLLATLMHNPSWSLANVAAMSSLVFPTVCPFLLMSHDSRASSFCLPLKRNISPKPLAKS
ncbi:vomeronasal type-1 receptor 2 [Mus musculus]|jgi:vomeronasal1 receptor|uniref:Vomeronasal type-1 receptor n=4 Tax=Mus musculus TaxID=10090 RepID=Q8R294_MOUSE|nr:vomeronasal type-1 receptor 2 [Mus musculus]AEF00474.1 vomeronasal type 1 receptor F5 [Mus musculus musculus]AEF00478.1 vomeronasal type 1 receptor F5 [Mus musculus domesticus]AAL47921.1 vomeronasal receptor V1RF5 [Mus musculus]AEF00479.1 vomeronasal type 1 receptor F5 [Mus musculus domesticus]AEF00480.1 vomeronasal type 1 receptor F5 [Mus musculus domesticus]|eukprot:NP_598963.1 vomeronasal type-1 receptor 2 [Mus musculus]